MTSPSCAQLRRIGLCAGITTGTMTLLVPVAAALSPTTPEAAAGRTVAPTEVAPGGGVWINPDPAVPGEVVLVHADCVGGAGEGSVYSSAFTGTALLRPAAHRTAPWRAEATVRSGVRPGERYVVTAHCGERQSLTSSFTVRATASRTAHPEAQKRVAHPRVGVAPRRYEAARPESTAAEQADRSANATPGGVGYSGARVGRPQDDVDNAALTMGGGLAAVGLTGYLLTLRRGNERRRRAHPDHNQPDHEQPDAAGRNAAGRSSARPGRTTTQQQAPAGRQVRDP